MATFKLEIVSLAGIAFSGDADMVTAPAWDGELGVLPGHAPMIAGLRHGVARVTAGGTTSHFAVDGGVLEVSAEGVMLLVRYAERGENHADAMNRLQRHLAEAGGPESRRPGPAAPAAGAS